MEQGPQRTMNQDLGYGLWKAQAYDKPDGEYSRAFKVRGLALEGCSQRQLVQLVCRRSLRRSLRHRTGDLRENRVDVGTDQADRTNHDYENNSQHHGILCNILPLVVGPELGKEEGHVGTNLE